MPDAVSSSIPDSAHPSANLPPLLANVIIPRHLNRSFTYVVPPELQASLRIGSQVRVPFGRSVLRGVVVAVFQNPDSQELSSLSNRLREITGLLDRAPDESLPQDLLTLSRMLAEHYLAPWGQCIRLILPPPTPSRPSVRYLLTEAGWHVHNKPERISRFSPVNREVLRQLAESSKGLALASLRKSVRGSLGPALSHLKRKGLVQECRREQKWRTSRHLSPGIASRGRDFSSDRQYVEGLSSPACQKWLTQVLAAIQTGQQASFVLQGSSGHRIGWMMRAAEATLAHRRQVLIVTPEITRAEVIAATVNARLGVRTELFHSGLSAAVRNDTWRRIRAGSVDVVVGTRSAIFAPLHALGLICLDHEDDPSLKEETEPRYHARDVARMRSRLSGAVLLLASAHPSLETLQRTGTFETRDQAGQELGPDKLLVVSRPAPPTIHLVDMRQVPSGTILSDPMVDGISSALESGEQVILYLNRKGFAPALLCRDCGHALRCQRCSVALTFYKQAGHLSCHYCNAVFPLPDTCPSCLAARLEPIGIGTESVEEIVRHLFPHAKVARLDREKARTLNRAEAIRRLFAAGELNVLIGTQMLFQGLPLPPVRFVGLIHADAGLHLPDFQAGERTYHALLDAIALAYPQEARGSSVLQTYLPTHPVIAAVVEQDPGIFYRQELMFRRTLAYPPFAHLIGLCVSGKHPERVKGAAEQWAERLKAALKPVGANEERRRKPSDGRGDYADASQASSADIVVLGPVAAPVVRIRGRYRWQILIKSADQEKARRVVRRTLDELERSREQQSGLKYEVDVDPVAMM